MSGEKKVAPQKSLRKTLSYKIQALRDFWNEYKRFKIGIAGLALLFILIGMAIAANIVVPADIRANWASNPRWVYNPKQVPPSWINMFSSEKYLEPTNLEPEETGDYWRVCIIQKIEENKEQLEQYPPDVRKKWIEFFEEQCKMQFKGRGYYYEYRFDLEADKVGKEIMIIIRNLEFNATIELDIYRPDGINLTGIKVVTTLKPTDESIQKLSFSESLASAVIENLIEPIDGEDAARDLEAKIKTGRAISPIPYIFMKALPGISNATTGTLKGEYIFRIYVKAVAVATGNATNTTATNITVSEYEEPEIILRFPGACYGLLGTDAKGRDNLVTILLGSQLALLLGFTYSIAAVIIGVIYGATSGYLRGSGKMWADEVLQRINEVIYSLPVLPFLIIFSYYLRIVYKIQPNIFHIAALLLIFGWSGVAIVTRSMALSVMGQPYIESAIALGARGRRILFKYVLPQLVPYAFAAIALNIPGAILMEAGLSFLGLTDPNMPSWGRMIYEAQNAIKAWWWVLPPGIMITITAVAFAFIGTALDTIVNPKLKGR